MQKLCAIWTAHISELIHYVSFCDCFILLSIMPSRSIRIVATLNFFPFQGWVIFHIIHMPHFVYPSICWWTFQLRPSFGYCDNAMNMGVQILKCFSKRNEQLNMWNYSSLRLFSPSILPQKFPSNFRSYLPKFLQSRLLMTRMLPSLVVNPGAPSHEPLSSNWWGGQWRVVDSLSSPDFQSATLLLVLFLPHWLFLFSLLCSFLLTSWAP